MKMKIVQIQEAHVDNEIWSENFLMMLACRCTQILPFILIDPPPPLSADKSNYSRYGIGIRISVRFLYDIYCLSFCTRLA